MEERKREWNPIKLLLNNSSNNNVVQKSESNDDSVWELSAILCPHFPTSAEDREKGQTNEEAIAFLESLVEQLKNSIANSVANVPPEDYLHFWAQILLSNEPNQKKLHHILKENVNKLDLNLAQLIQVWTNTVLPVVEPSQARRLAAKIANFSSLMGEITIGNRLANIEVQIFGYESIVDIFTKEEYPQQWATLQNNLGNAYGDRIQGEKADNIEVALGFYQRALQVRTRESAPQEWAATQNNLGRALCNRIYGDKAENLEMAIASYQSALQVYNRRSFPKEWATTQNNLANAYSDRIRGLRADNLECAIECYQKALEVRTKENSPHQWAKTQINLGRVFCDRLLGNKTTNLKQAINCYQSALQYYQRDRMPDRWATVQIYLGHTYSKYALQLTVKEEASHPNTPLKILESNEDISQEKAIDRNIWVNNLLEEDHILPSDPEAIKVECSASLSTAISCYQNALQVCPKFSERWAIIQIHLANIYSDPLLSGERSANLRAALACYQNASQVYNRNVYPDRWAKLQLQMASAHRLLRDAQSNHLNQAITCYKNALLVYNRDSLPQNYAKTLLDLGVVYQEKGDLQLAYESLNKAVESVEFMRGQVVADSLAAKHKLAQTWTKLYQSMIQVCLQLAEKNNEYYIRALEYVERNKSRSLVESLSNCHLYPKASEVGESVLAELDQIRHDIANESQRLDRSEQDDLNRYLMSVGKFQTQGSFLSALTSDYHQVNQLRQRFDQLIDEKIAPHDPYFKPVHKVEPISYKQIQELLLDKQTVILELAHIGEVLLVFIIEQEGEQPIVLQYPTDSAIALEKWVADYLTAYTEQRGRWVNQLGNRLTQLAEIIEIERVLKHIPDKYDRLVIIPDGYLHLVPLHALPVNPKMAKNTNQPFVPYSQYLLDRFNKGIRYAPSARILQMTQIYDRSMRVVSSTPPRYLLAIGNSTQDGFYANLEIANARRHFSEVRYLEPQKATKTAFYQVIDPELDTATGTTEATLNALLQLGNCSHFSCPGILHLNNPTESSLTLVDEPIKLEEICNIDWRQSRLVTLSACEISTFSEEKKLGEYVGLPSGFLYGGVATVVSSLWKVSDISTLLLINKYYDTLMKMPRLKMGDAAIALNTAQRWIRELTTEELEAILEQNKSLIDKTFSQLSTTKKLLAQASLQQVKNRKPCPFAHPYHWAGFTVIGL